MTQDKQDAGTAPAVDSPSDHSLLCRYRRGCQDAATQLYLRYAERLHGLARAQLAPALARCVEVDDLVQSVFGSFFRRAGHGYYDVPAGEELWRLFLVIALHKIRNQAAYHHAAKRDVRRTEAGEQVVDLPATGDSAAFAFLQLAIDEALQRLPPAHKEMIELRIEGYEVAEIAGKTGRARRTVERFLQEARQRLGEILGEGR
jgi:RNA polymerase sigma-70 factor (ECF subfamily)